MIKPAVLLSVFAASLTTAATSALACAPVDAVQLTSKRSTPFKAYAELGLEAISQPFAIDLYFCGDTIDSIDRIKVDAIMPSHQHGMNYTPEIKRTDPGVYRVTGMFFHMPGTWELQVSTHSDSEANQRPYLFKLDILAR